MSDGIGYHPLVQELMADIRANAGMLGFSVDDLSRWSRRVQQLPNGQRKEVAIHLVTLAMEVEHRIGDSAQLLIQQLAGLVAGLMPPLDTAASTETVSGSSTKDSEYRKQVAKMTGLQVGPEPTEQATTSPEVKSLLDLLISRK